MKLILFFLLFCLSGYFATAQTSTLSKIQEVYAEKTDEIVLQHPDLLKVLTDLVENRVKISLLALDAINDKYPKLSQINLVNKYNSALRRDATFDPNSFNPLKYNFITSAKTPMVYRVDNTDYIIIIAPQSFK